MIVVIVETRVKSSDGVDVRADEVERILTRADAVYYNGDEANRKWLERSFGIRIGRFRPWVIKQKDVRPILFDPDGFEFLLQPRYWYKTIHGIE